MRREVSCQRLAAESIWALPMEERVAGGHSLGPLRVTAVSTQRLTLGSETTAAQFAPCTLREGSHVRLSRNTPTSPAAHAVLLGEDSDGFHFEVRKKGFNPSPADGWTIDPDFMDLTDMFAAAIDALATTALGRGRIMPLLMGHSGSILDGERYDEEMSSFENPVEGAGQWRDSQQEAIAACMAAADAFLVQGPPGTGKTRVLAEIAARLIAAGQRVLITGPTHRAIHQALCAVRSAVPASVKVVKIGPAPLGGNDIECYESYPDSGLIEGGDPHVVGATPYALWSKYRGLHEAMFDTVLIDEASQITPLLAAMAMLRAEKWLFFGDDRQLPPVVLADTGAVPRLRSVFGVLKDRDFDCMLTETWRLSRALAEWPSATFYGNRLVARHDRRLQLDPPSALPDLASESALFLHLSENSAGTVRNDGDAMHVARLVRDLVAGGVVPEMIGVITPFRAQAARIRQLLAINHGFADLNRRVLVDTVERFQGQEREVILISLAAAKMNFIARRADFIFQPERLNVAVTRARVKTVLVASRGLVAAAESLADAGHAGAICFSSLVAHLCAHQSQVAT